MRFHLNDNNIGFRPQIARKVSVKITWSWGKDRTERKLRKVF